MVVVSASVAPLGQAAVCVGSTVFYASRHVLCIWSPKNHEVRILGALDARITAVVAGGDQVYIGTDAGSLYVFANEAIRLVDSLPTSVTCLAVGLLLVAGCMDGSTYVYPERDPARRMRFSNKGYALAVATHDNLVFVGGTSVQLQVYDHVTDDSVLVDGHENWVRALSLRQEADGGLLLASASQEKCVRLWSVRKMVSADAFRASVRLGPWAIEFEALLIGHDDWVVAVQWDPKGPSLMSASADSSLIVWEHSAGVYTPAARFGDVSIWGASTATGTSGGFWNCLWTDELVLTSTATGSFRAWTRSGDAVPAPTGHFKDIMDCQWFAPGFLLTTSHDQTTRLWEARDDELLEVGRPQIHGYDMVCVAPLSAVEFASAGEEKVVRVFRMPRAVARQLEARGLDFDDADLPEVAGAPALGLSNKPEEDLHVELPSVPREDQLQRITLWPETEKLYGHGYEVAAVAHVGGFLASSAGANTLQHGGIRFYDVHTWRELKPPVLGHTLTITRLAPSPDGRLLLSVGRDRKYMLTDVLSRAVVLQMEKAHSRVIYDGCFATDDTFVTASRDKTVKMWKITGNVLATYATHSPATAVAANRDYVAIGEESGLVTLLNHQLQPIRPADALELAIPGRVNRLSFQANKLAAAGCVLSVFNLETD